MFNEKQIAILNQELDSNRIKSRQKGNINLSYLEGFDILNTANQVFGFGNWSYKVSSLEMVSQEANHNQNHIVCYKAVVQVLVHDENHTKDISREDVGFGSGIAKTLADAHEGGAKEAVTDALKRTLRSFGNQFGNSLYNRSRTQPQQQNYQPPQNNNNQSFQQQAIQQAPYRNQQDFGQLTNLGLQVIQQGQNLVVVGETVFENKEAIKQNGFRWDGQNKNWYMPIGQAA